MRIAANFKKYIVVTSFCLLALSCNNETRAEKSGQIEIENEYLKYVIAPDGTNAGFIDKKFGTDYCLMQPASKFARVIKADKEYEASSVVSDNGKMTVQFADAAVTAVIEVVAKKHYLTFKVLSVSDEKIHGLVFTNISLTGKSTIEDEFAGCALALNLKTNVNEMPGANKNIQATCYSRFGLVGAKAAIIGCPKDELRNVLKEAVSAAEELPHSPLGGPWALDAPTNKESYLFASNVTEQTVDSWVNLCKQVGIRQVQFSGWSSFIFGDCRPNPTIYPKGIESMKAVVDKLHAAGIKAGMHTYACFINKASTYVTPIPDPRLAKDGTFTLTEPLAAEGNNVAVAETTKDVPTFAGWDTRTSVTIQIDNELITYTGANKQAPFAFTGCTRGALGTKPAAHGKGAKVYHLKEVFYCFVPDQNSTLFTEVAEQTAKTYNECGFDMIYLDAIDGADVFAGENNAWYYASKFVFELSKRFKKPALLETSLFTHHMWNVRSRMGAWDHPERGHKGFIDLHVVSNELGKRMFLPTHLGWWSFTTWAWPLKANQQYLGGGEPTFSDDIEYLCCKSLGNNSSLSLQFGAVNPSTYTQNPYMAKLAGLVKKYETLRLENYFDKGILAKLREPGQEFTLIQNQKGRWEFYPIQYDKHKVADTEGLSNLWQMKNKFGKQPVKLRIEALMSAGPYDGPNNIVLADFNSPEKVFTDTETAKGISAKLEPSAEQVKIDASSGYFTATNSNSDSFSAKPRTWAKIGKKLSPPLDLIKHQAIGLWIYGDGRGEVLNIQLRSPKTSIFAIGEHYVVIDFKGWRYFELIEAEGDLVKDYSWPYSHLANYAILIFSVNYSSIETLDLWYNNIAPGATVGCFLSPIKALPLVEEKITNPSITIGGKKIVFPVEMKTGCFIEFYSMTDCKLYNPDGTLNREVQPQGDIPVLEAGQNQIKFDCGVEPKVRARASVTLISQADTVISK
jgi:hypothetical protein